MAAAPQFCCNCTGVWDMGSRDHPPPTRLHLHCVLSQVSTEPWSHEVPERSGVEGSDCFERTPGDQGEEMTSSYTAAAWAMSANMIA